MPTIRCETIAIGMIFLLAGCGEKREVASVWNSGAARVDGKGAEWAEVPLDYSEAAEVSWGIMNDSDRLYLIVVSSSESSIRMLNHSGIALWFSGTGDKKKREFGVRLRGGMTPWIRPRTGDQVEDQPPAEAEQPSHDSYALALDLTALDDKGQQKSLSKTGEDGPVAAAGCEEGVCSYEMSVPLIKTDAVRYAITAVQGKKIGIGVELSVPKRSRRSDEEETSGMGPHGGSGRHQGMGSRGMDQGDRDTAGRGSSSDDKDQHGPGGRNSDRNGHEKHKPIELEKKEIWLSVTLATRPPDQGAH